MSLKKLLSGARYGKYDKTVHLSLAFVLTIIALIIFPLYQAVLGVAFLGLLKEFYDAQQKDSSFDWADIATNIIGISVAVFTWSILKSI